MYSMTGKPLDVTKNHIHYKIDTSEGQSGSGVWVQNNNPYYVGVHTTGGKDQNRAVRLTKNKLQYISRWRAQYEENKGETKLIKKSSMVLRKKGIK